jgi:8-oxo-dGTP diphosphatase
MKTNEYPDRPRVAVGAVVIHDDRVLLVQRGKPPSFGQWAIPGGSVELGETLQVAAEREILEETGVQIEAKEIVYTFENIQWDEKKRPRFHYVIIDFVGRYIRGEPAGQDDADAARWVSFADIAGLDVNANTLELLRKVGFLV